MSVSAGRIYGGSGFEPPTESVPENKVRTLIVIVFPKLLKRHSKAKRRAPAYSQALYRDVAQKNSGEVNISCSFARNLVVFSYSSFYKRRNHRGFGLVKLPPKGPSIKYVTLFLPPSPCHTSSHIPGPPRKYVTQLGSPNFFRRPSTQNPDKSPLVQILYQLFAGGFVRGVVRGAFVWKVLSGWFLCVGVVSEYICYNRKLNVHHFKFHVSYV